MDNENRPSRLPDSVNYGVLNGDIDNYILSELSIVAGHQGFDNNILMIEAFMKILPQALFAKEMGKFDNPITKQKCQVDIPRIYIDRLQDIWRKGLYCIVIRDEYDTSRIRQRIVAFKMEENEIKIRDKTFLNPWEVMSPCLNPDCKKVGLVGFMLDEDYSVDETKCELKCKECGFNGIFEVEIKPALKLMIPLRPRSTNPIWVNTKACPMVKYALENVDLLVLSSNEGGFVYDISPNNRPPRYETAQQIQNSIDKTSFPSQQYYDDTTGLEFDCWSFYYNKTLILLHEMVKGKYAMPTENKEKEKRKRMEL